MNDETKPLTEADLNEIMARRKFSVGHDYAPEIERLVAEVRRLWNLRAAVLAYDEAIQEAARQGRSWVASEKLDRLFEEMIVLCGQESL